MKLPEGYTVERDPDVLTLIGPGGELVARFDPGADPAEVEKAAWSHQRSRSHRELAVSAIVGLAAGAALAWCYGLASTL